MMKFAYLIPLFPLIGFLINGLGRNKLSKGLAGGIGSISVLASFVLSLCVFLETKSDSPVFTIQLFDFIAVGKLSIPFALQIDQLTILFLLIITGIGFLIHLYSTAYMHEEESRHFARYFSYLNLFVFFMLLLVMGANYVILFIGWEGVGLCSYLLIGFWFKNKAYNNAAKKAFIMNRIGDLGVLLAIFWMIQKFGTVTYAGVFDQVAQPSKFGMNDPAMVGITLLLFIGATGKSAQIPLYTWLPDAMAGPTPVSALIHAATMVTAGIYMIARSNVMYMFAATTCNIITAIGLTTAVLAATIAIKQNDIKKVLAYSTVSQLGFMFVALGLGACTAAVFHVITHAFFKALMFLGAGSVIHGMHHEQDMRRYGGLKKYMPVTHATFLIGCLAISGVPFFSGFFSKDEILEAAMERSPLLYWAGLGAALMTAFYMFRLYAMTFLGKFRGDSNHPPHESPAAMTIPLIILAILAAIGGFIGIPELFKADAHWLKHFLFFVCPTTFDQMDPAGVYKMHDPKGELMLLGISTLLILIVIFFAITKFRKYQLTDKKESGFGKILANKWYVDELYEVLIVKPVNAIGAIFNGIIEKGIIDKIVNGFGRGVLYGSRKMRHLQSGIIGNYILIMVIMMVVFFLIGFGFTPDFGKIKTLFGK